MLADITVNTETMVVISGVVGALTTAVVFLFFMVIKAYQDALAEEKADSVSWRDIALTGDAAAARAKLAANKAEATNAGP